MRLLSFIRFHHGWRELKRGNVMLDYLVVISCCLLCGFSLILKKQHGNVVLIPLVILLVILMGGTYICSDYSMYETMFYASKYLDFSSFSVEESREVGYSRDIGYSLLNYIGYVILDDYMIFKFAASALFLSILLMKVSKITYYVAIPILLYLYFPFFMDVVEVRNFIGEVFLFLGIYEYVFSTKHKLCKFYIYIMISASIHSVFAIYTLFPCINALKHNAKKKWLYNFVLIVGLCMPLYESYILAQIQVYLNMYQTLVASPGHFNAYLAQANTRFGFIVSYIKVVAIVLLLKYIVGKINNSENIFTLQQKSYSVTIYDFFLYMCMLFPIIGLDATVTRIPRNLFIEVYVVCSYYFLVLKNAKEKLFFLVVVLGIVSIWAFHDVYMNLDAIINLDKNIILEYLFL